VNGREKEREKKRERGRERNSDTCMDMYTYIYTRNTSIYLYAYLICIYKYDAVGKYFVRIQNKKMFFKNTKYSLKIRKWI